MAYTSGYNSNAVALYEALKPRTNYAQLRASKDQELAMQAQLTAMSQQEQQIAQQQALNVENAKNQINSLPFMGIDASNKSKWMNEYKKQVEEKIKKDYNGDARSFFDAEGASISQKILSDFQNSDVYKRGKQNLTNISMALDAQKNGHNIIGGIDSNGKYRTGESMMSDFMAGKLESFNWSGSYKNDIGNSMLEHFSKLDNPINKFGFDTVPLQEKAAFLSAKYGNDPLVLADYNARGGLNTPIPYKRYSLTDAQEYQDKRDERLLDRNIKIANEARKQQMFPYQVASEQANLTLKQQKIAENNGQSDSTSPSFYDKVIGNMQLENRYEFKPAQGVNTQIKTLGLDLNDYSENGVLNVNKASIPQKNVQSAVASLAGFNGKDGQIKEGIVLQNGGGVIDFSKIPHTVVSVDGNFYSFGKQINRSSSGKVTNIDGNAFTKATIRLTEDEAKAAGLIEGTIWDSSTQLGAGMKEVKEGGMIVKDNGLEFEVLVPIKGLFKDKLIQQSLQGSFETKKVATEAYSSSTMIDI